jgi:type III secretory pathway component EscV
MGKKLGNALIIYGILNFLFSLVLGIPILIIGALIWMIIMIAIGNWQRSKARAEKARDKQTELLKRVADKLDEKDKTEPDNGIRYTKD